MTDVEVRHVEGGTFLALGPSNHYVLMDALPDDHGRDGAAGPMELVLMALGGCSGIDVELMLKKMRVKPAEFRIRISAERADTDPRIYTRIHMVYHFWGEHLDRAKLERAVQLSTEKYCSVSNMLDKSAALSTDIIVHPEST